MFKVSIIVPIYNAEKYLKKCLDSIVNQTLKDIEIILIDDGSTDGSAEICRQYLSDSRVSYCFKENEGLAAARQDGMDRARGEYLGFVDSDDWIELNMYEKMYAVAIKHNADVVFCNCFDQDERVEHIYLEPGVYDRERIKSEIIPRSLASLNKRGFDGVIRWSNCLRIYKKVTIEENHIRFERGFRRSQDLQLTFETALVAQTYVSMCDEFLYHNRTDNNAYSLSRGFTKNYWELYKLLIDKLKSDVEAYKEQDLSYNMALRTFFFAVTGVQNEMKCTSYTKAELDAKIEEIICDKRVSDALKKLDGENFSLYNKLMFEAFKKGSTKNVFAAIGKFKRQEKFRTEVKAPIMNFLTESRIVGTAYKRIRGKN